MSHAATHWAMQIDAPTPAAKLVLLILADAHNGHTGECRVTVRPLLPEAVEAA